MLSVVIPAKNEEANLGACLQSLGDLTDDVWVIDSGSDDRTAEIGAEYGATVVQFQWDGKFPKKRNWVLKSCDLKHDWVLFLDADERLTLDAVAEIKSALSTTSHVGFWITYENYFLDTKLEHGDPFRKLALFRRSAGQYERFPEVLWSNLDMEVHEHPVLEGTTGELRSQLRHQDYRGLKHYIGKHNEYSSWEANRYAWLQDNPEAWASLTQRQQFKYRNLARAWFASFYFLSTYVLKRGFMDGYAGWVFAHFKRRYYADIRLKIREAARRRHA